MYQRDLSGVAASLKACSDPHLYPKTVIFCGRKEVICNVYQYLKVAAKLPYYVTMYHASISDETKEAVYSDFVSGRVCCLVSTIAFGMVGFSCITGHLVDKHASNVGCGHPRHTGSNNVWNAI